MGERQTYIPVEAMGMTEEMAQEVELNRSCKGGKKDWDHFTPEFVGVHAQDVSVGDLLRQAQEVRTNFEKGRLEQNDGIVKFSKDAPISIAFLGDLHFGSVFAENDEIVRKFNEVRDTPNMYCVFMSNLIDNAIPSQFPSNMLNNSLNPDKQVLGMRKMIEELNTKGKVLGAVTSPCHEGWTWKHTGQDINQLIFGFEGRKFPVLENGGRLTLQFPSVKYEGNLYHQVGPFESNFNKTHALKQLNRLNLDMTADFVAGAHRHVNAVEQVFEGMGDNRRLITYIRTGCEKGVGDLHDGFSVGKYGKSGEPSGPVLTLFGDHKSMIGNADFDTGVLCHEAVLVADIVNKTK